MTNRRHVLVTVASLAAVIAPFGPLVCVAGAASQSIQFDQDNRALGIPFTIIDDQIHLQVTVNGRAKVDMVLDTGFGSKGALLLDPEIGNLLGLDYVTQVDLGGGGTGQRRNAGVALGATFSLPGVRFADQQLFVMLDGEPYKDWPAEGIIGGTLLDCIVEIDYENTLINLYRDRLPDDPGQEFAVTFTHGIPVIQTTVVVDRGEPILAKLIVDTGCNDPLLLFTHSDERMRPQGPTIRGIEGVLSDGLTGKMLGSVGRISRLEIGPFVLNRVTTCFPDKATMGSALQLGHNGMLGNEILERFKVVFDYAGGLMFLKPNDGYALPFEFNMAGLVLQANPQGHLIVKDVIKDSPGEQSGIRQWDIILAVNGWNLERRTTDEALCLFTEDGARLLLTIVRGPERLSLQLTLKRMI